MSQQESILVVSANQSTVYLVKHRFVDCGYDVRSVQGLNQLLLLEAEYKPRIAIIEATKSQSSEDVSSIIASIQSQMEGVGILVTYNQGVEINAAELFRVGALGIYRFPYEEELLIDAVFEHAPVEIPLTALTAAVMAEVSILELKEAQALPFDVFIYMPKNDKFLLYRKKDSHFEPKVASRFEEHHRGTFFIRKSDLKSYSKYTVDVLAKIRNDQSLTRIEKQKKLKGEMKNLVSDFFTRVNFSQTESKTFLNTVGKIVNEYLGETSKGHLFQRISDLTLRSFSNYSHSTNTATYCAIFGMLTEFDELEQLGIGGLLHDIGLCEVPAEILELDPSEMNKAQLDQYKLHPLVALDIIAQKGIPVSDVINDMISQHHEVPDGSGYPRGLKGDEISPYAKILALADYFDEVTSQKSGSQIVTPRDALMKLLGEDGEVPTFFDPVFHTPIIQGLIGNMDSDTEDEPPLQEEGEETEKEEAEKIAALMQFLEQDEAA